MDHLLQPAYLAMLIVLCGVIRHTQCVASDPTEHSSNNQQQLYWPLGMEPYDAVRYHANRTRRQLSSWVSSLALPPRSIVSIAPRFGWLLYQGSDVEEELDFVLQSEFIYRFPEHETAHSHNTSDSHHGRHESPSHVTHSDWAGQQPTVHYVDHVASASAPHAMALNFDHNWQLQTQWQAADASSGGAARSRRSTSTAQSKRNSRMAADKVTLYKAFENVMSLMGVDGRACLLQAICEITNKPLLYDGIVGELLNLLLLPSHTNGEHSLLTDFVKTEQLVREAAAAGDRSSCASRYPSCRLALFEHSTAHLS